MEKELKRLPAEFVRRLREICPSHFLSLSRSFRGREELVFRLNYLRIERQEALKYLESLAFKFKEVNWLKGSFVSAAGSKQFLQASSLYQEGKIYIQGLSSMFAAYTLEAQAGENIGDFCASPGGKTTFLASWLRGNCRIIAFEKQKVRFYKLMANLRHQAAEKAVKAYIFDAGYAFRKYPEYFERILVDAPCSAEGRFLINNPRTWRYWSERKIRESQRRQKRILFSAVKSLKPQGVLVYSTCTFAPEENEEVIDWLLRKFPRTLELEKIKTPFSNVVCGLSSFRGRRFSDSLKLACRIIPAGDMEGFFVAKLRKLKGGGNGSGRENL